MEIAKTLSKELNIPENIVTNTLNLISDGCSIPFIARYRKEVTSNLQDYQIRELDERYNYYLKLESRKETILNSIEEQNKLTPELKESIDNCLILADLEDIYRPYIIKKESKAQIAKNLGLESLAKYIRYDLTNNLKNESKQYINLEKGIDSQDKATNMAYDILKDEISNKTLYRKKLKELINENGILKVKLKKDRTSDTYDTYEDFSCYISKIKPHQTLAIFRGEKQKCLSYDIELELDDFFKMIYKKEFNINSPYKKELELLIKEAFTKYIKPSTYNDIYNDLFDKAQEKSLETFKVNLKNLLLASPCKDGIIMGFDPGFTNGCKIAIVDQLSNVLYTFKTFVTVIKDENKIEEELKRIASIIDKYNVKYIALGNGTASKQSQLLLARMLKDNVKCKIIIVSEDGASIYSASKLGIEEFPDYDVALRSAVSIARRLIDPLSELVKIEPENLGVGQYQHDLNQKRLKEVLTGVVEDAVNNVGVDVNFASKSLLTYVSGIGNALANNIVNYRNEHGKFKNREELKNVPRFSSKVFLNSAGFLKIRDGDNFLDTTSIHPESYEYANKIVKKYDIKDLDDARNKLGRLSKNDLENLQQELGISKDLFDDIINNLTSNQEDIRDKFKISSLNDRILSIEDIRVGDILQGKIMNVSDFGCFVDLGIHEHGLIHISQIAKTFVTNINDYVQVNDVVKVKVIDIDMKRKRISLSLKDVK